MWRGESLDQRGILIQAEPRADDTLAFRKYLPMLMERGGRVILRAPAEVSSAFAGVPGVGRVIDPEAANDVAMLETVQWRCAIGSLPLWLGPAADSIPLDLSPERLLSAW